ncbi:MAG: ABC transporter permease, partial [Rhodospirillales bacterium]|nr:ABC transporter permease [Rhodospirillales bacterium]
TTIAMETGKGNLALALGLGIVLIAISLIVNGLTFGLGIATRFEKAPT